MGIDKLTKAAAAAGYAMANSEDLLQPSPAPKKDEAQSWRVADPVRHSRVQSAKLTSSVRDWWLTLSSKATA